MVADMNQILRDAQFERLPPADGDDVYVIANGDLRLAANQAGEAVQVETEKKVMAVMRQKGLNPRRAHSYDPTKRHGFIDSQEMGDAVFAGVPGLYPGIPTNAIVAPVISVWEYSHQILGALVGRHKGPILTIANYSGGAPGLVGLSNTNASMFKHGREFATVWSENFDDEFFMQCMEEFVQHRKITHSTDHIHHWQEVVAAERNPDYQLAMRIGEAFAERLMYNRARIGPLDEMCMGMENAVIGNELLYPMGIGKENISQSELVARMETVSDDEGKAVIDWCRKKGMTFHTGTKDEDDLTEAQLIEQGKMYIAAVRIADKYGLTAIGIQYQQGLKDSTPASDLVEGLLNNPDRPDVIADEGKNKGKVIRKGRAIPCFNEVDEGCAVDLIFSNPLWRAFGEDPSANQEDVRWSKVFDGMITGAGKSLRINEEVWVDLLSGSAPASHFVGGYGGAHGWRQPKMYFPKGGSTLSGIGKPGEMVISRVYINGKGELCMNLMRGAAVALPHAETTARLDATTPEWPIKHVVRYGVTRNNMILHPSNHETVLYASSAEQANRLMLAKGAMAAKAGLKVQIWGNYDNKYSIEHRLAA